MKKQDYKRIQQELAYVLAHLISNDQIPNELEYVQYGSKTLKGNNTYRYQNFVALQRQKVLIYVNNTCIAAFEGPKHPTLYRQAWEDYPERMYLTLLDKIMDKYPEVKVINDL